MEYQFKDPSVGDVLKPIDINGHLLIVRPNERRSGVVTTFGESDAIVCDVADLDTGVVSNNVMWFATGLVASLTPNIGDLVLGRLTQGQAKPGQSAPWVLAPQTEDPAAVHRASQWLSANPAFQGITAPATPGAPSGYA